MKQVWIGARLFMLTLFILSIGIAIGGFILLSMGLVDIVQLNNTGIWAIIYCMMGVIMLFGGAVFAYYFKDILIE